MPRQEADASPEAALSGDDMASIQEFGKGLADSRGRPWQEAGASPEAALSGDDMASVQEFGKGLANSRGRPWQEADASPEAALTDGDMISIGAEGFSTRIKPLSCSTSGVLLPNVKSKHHAPS